MVIELRVVQFWSEIILVISNRTHAARSIDFEITRMISDQIALHSVQLPLLTVRLKRNSKRISGNSPCLLRGPGQGYMHCFADDTINWG